MFKYITILFSIIFLFVSYIVYEAPPHEKYDITGRDYKAQGGPQGRFIVEVEYPAYTLYDWGPYGENQEKIKLGGSFIWTCEEYDNKFWCYGEDGMLIINNEKLYIQFIKKSGSNTNNTAHILQARYMPTEYAILHTPMVLSKREFTEYEKLKKRGEQERINRLGIHGEKVDWNNPFQRIKLDTK